MTYTGGFPVHPKLWSFALFAFCLHFATALGDYEFLHAASEELLTVSEPSSPQLHVVLMISASNSMGRHDVLVCVRP